MTAWYDTIVTNIKTALEAKFVKKSNTSGLLKNDGTVDTTSYLTNADKTVVENNLTSTSTTNALSAAQGKALNEAINNITVGDVDLSSTHTHDTSYVTNETAYNNIKAGESTTLTLDTQAKINAAINDKIGALSNVDIIIMTTDKGAPTDDKLNKFYIVPDNGKLEVYYVQKKVGPTNDWVKFDTIILDNLSVDWSEIQNKPSIVNNLSSTSTTDALSAAQGNALATNLSNLRATTILYDTSDLTYGNASISDVVNSKLTADEVHTEITNFANALANAINPQ